MSEQLLAQVPSGELEQRLHGLQELLRREGIAAAVIVEAADLYYFTGTVQDAHLVAPAETAPLLLVRRSLERAQLESTLAEIRPLRSLRELRPLLEAAGLLGERIGFELDVLPAGRLQVYEQLLAPCVSVDCSAAIRTLRARKSAWELARIAAAARLLDDAFAHVPQLVHECSAEIELAAALEHHLRLAGHDGYVRTRGLNQEMHYGFVLAGPSAAVPGGADAAIIGPGLNAAVGKGSSRRQIKAREPIMVDLVGAKEGYLADETRTFALASLEDSWHETHADAVTILDAVAAAAKPGVTGAQLYELALALVGDRPGFMGVEPVSFVGHGLGLQINEPPFLARGQQQPLEAGQVFALEPKFALAGKGAVGIENTYVVEASGARSLTAAPHTLTII